MTVREQLFTLLRNLRWIAVFSVLISILLYLPDQIQELYRIAADDIGWVTLKEFVAVGVIALTIWAAAFQLSAATLPHIPPARLGHAHIWCDGLTRVRRGDSRIGSLCASYCCTPWFGRGCRDVV
ncbi:hypothetical protein, partial [Bradyrhizobium sp. IC3195]|uniref:hypothetical protein n=1 Tax=Bradyrhizobium sp. IC3195 TaxID=2793804 RepID=UPI001CD6F3C0